jgi:hypothetical protein
LSIEEYLEEVLISENDPGLLFNWDDAALTSFVEVASAPRQTVSPVWLTLLGMTIQSVKSDIIRNAALLSGGSFGNTLIAPNSMVQCMNVGDCISQMEMHPFIQECLALLPDNIVLGNVAIIMDKTIAHAIPAGRVVPAGSRLMFA